MNVFQLVGEQEGALVEQRLEIDLSDIEGFGPAEVEELAHDRLDLPQALVEEGQVAFDQFPVVGILAHRFDAVEHPAERVVDLVGDSGGEDAERGHLFAEVGLGPGLQQFVPGLLQPVAEQHEGVADTVQLIPDQRRQQVLFRRIFGKTVHRLRQPADPVDDERFEHQEERRGDDQDAGYADEHQRMDVPCDQLVRPVDGDGDRQPAADIAQGVTVPGMAAEA